MGMHAWAWKLTKAVVKATDGGDWEMLAPSTNDGCVIRSTNSKAHKWNVHVTANKDELKVVITTKYYEYFYLECGGMLQSNYSWGAL